MTYAQKFSSKAQDLMPHQLDLWDIPQNIDDADHVDDLIFSKSEYLGGMAAVIREIIEREK